MSAAASSQAFAAASSAMVRGIDAASTVHVLMSDSVRLLGADTAGILVRTGESDLELLAAHSHRASALEMHQANSASGPCFDAVKTGKLVSVAGAAEIVKRWPDFGAVMLAAGLHAVRAVPMRWHGRVLGGLNLFWASAAPMSIDDRQMAQAFADTCTLALMQDSDGADATRLVAQLRAALRGRVVIERAKGVLVQTDGLDMAGAFERLVQLSDDSAEPLAVIAHRVVNSVHMPPPT